MKKVMMFFSVAILLLVTNFSAQAQQWSKLGERMVDFSVDHDEIAVTAYKGAYTKLKLVVSKAPIHLHNIRIVYGNGESTNIKVDKNIEQGTETKPFDLPGDKRIIKKIVFNYKSIPTFKGRGHIEVFGKH